MNADVNNQQCMCELCQPNWYMGHDGETFQPQPAEQEARQVTLEELHVRKVARQTTAEFAPATG